MKITTDANNVTLCRLRETPEAARQHRKLISDTGKESPAGCDRVHRLLRNWARHHRGSVLCQK
jgi:hypothetical protein